MFNIVLYTFNKIEKKTLKKKTSVKGLEIELKENVQACAVL